MESYLKGKDGKIKGIENLEGLPDCTIYKTDKPEVIMANGKKFVIITDMAAPEEFYSW